MKVILTLLLQQYEFELIHKNPKTVKGPKTKWPESPTEVRYKRIKNAPAYSTADYLAALYQAKETATDKCPFHKEG